MGLKKAPRIAIARRRLRLQLLAVGVGLIAVLVPTVAFAGGGGGHTEKGPGGYPASQFERDDDGRIGLVCSDHVYSPGETTTTTQPGQPNPSCRPMTRNELHKEKTNPTKEAPTGDSQTPTPGAPIYPTTTSTTVTK